MEIYLHGLNYSLLKVHNHALSRCHIFTLFSHNRHDHARIRVLVSSSLKKNILLFITSVILIFKGEVIILYTLRMKNQRINNPRPPFPFPIPTIRLSDTSSTYDFMTKFTFFCSKYKALGFPQFPCRSY